MTIFWMGGEDEAFTNVGGCSVSTTSGTFNAVRSRCSLMVPGQTGGPQAQYWAARNIFSLAAFWTTVKCWVSENFQNSGTAANFFLIRFVDSAGIVRLRLIGSSTSQNPSQNWVLQKVNAAGTATTLATSIAGFAGGFPTPPEVKFDFQINYSTGGQFVWYVSGIPVLSYAGDVTTDSVTSLAGFDLGQGFVAGNTSFGGLTYWAEGIVADVDTRSLNLYTLPPTGAGATSQWNGASNGSTVNEITLSDANGIDTTGTAEIELFTQGGTLTGPFITAIGVSARVITSSGQPQHVDAIIRQNSTNYASADLAVGTAFGNVQGIWANDPNTGLPWASITGTQIGVESKA